MAYDFPNSPNPGDQTADGEWTWDGSVWKPVGVAVPLVASDITTATGAGIVENAVSISQADYDAIGTPDPETLYLIDG